jgi:streptogramin lyase
MNSRVGITIACGCLALAGTLAGQIITEFPVPTLGSGPQDVAAGSDGSLWFTEQAANQIGRITTTGVVAEFPIPTANSLPQGIAAGSDGNLWFTEQAANQIGRITTSGVVTEFVIPTTNSNPWYIAAGPDGNLWFTEYFGKKVGRITTAGAITEFVVATAGNPFGITAGPDGNLWFTEQNGKGVRRITTAGIITEFLAPSGFMNRIAAGSDGNLWFAEAIGNIGRITTSGVVTEFPAANANLYGITAGPDGNLWFTDLSPDRIGRIATAGVFLGELPVPTAGIQVLGITPGPDGNLWFTESGLAGVPTAQIGRITIGSCVADDTTLCLSANRFRVTADFETADGQRGSAHANAITANTGYFWFFDPTNVEVVTKVLPYCADPFNSIWIFAAGLTNVKVDLTYTDMSNGIVVMKHNGLGTPFAPVQDTEAFKTCP